MGGRSRSTLDSGMEGRGRAAGLSGLRFLFFSFISSSKQLTFILILIFTSYLLN